MSLRGCIGDSINFLVSSCLQKNARRLSPLTFLTMPSWWSKASARFRFLVARILISAVACSEPALRFPVAYRSGIVLVMLCSQVSFFAYLGAPRWPRARLTVARPLARPTPRPRVPRDLNMGAFLCKIRQRLSIFLLAAFHFVPQHIGNDK